MDSHNLQQKSETNLDQGTLNVSVIENQCVANPLVGVPCVQVVGGGDAGPPVEEGHQVMQVDELGGSFARGKTLAADDHRCSGAVFIEILLAKQTMTAHSESMIGEEHHDGVVGLATFIERLENSAHLSIELFDHPVVIAEVPTQRFGGSGPCFEFFIANPQFAVVEGVLGKDVGGQGQVFIVDVFPNLPGRGSWVMYSKHVRSHALV